MDNKFLIKNVSFFFFFKNVSFKQNILQNAIPKVEII